MGFVLHKIAQNTRCTSKAKHGRWERETRFSLTALNPAPASTIKTNPSLMNLQTYLMVYIYTYTAYTIRVLHAGRTGHLPHRKHQWKKPVGVPKAPALSLLKAFRHTMKKFTVETKTLVLTLYYLVHDITVVALSRSEATPQCGLHTHSALNVTAPGSWAVMGVRGRGPETGAMGSL